MEFTGSIPGLEQAPIKREHETKQQIDGLTRVPRLALLFRFWLTKSPTDWVSDSFNMMKASLFLVRESGNQE